MKILKTTLKGLFIAFFAVLILYIGFQIISILNPSYRSETAVLYTVTDSVPCRGIAVRNETIINYNTAGTLNFRVSDGDKIATNSVVADVYSSKTIARDVKVRAILQDERSVLRTASESKQNANINLDSVSNQIYRIMTNLSGSIESNTFAKFEEYRLSAVEQISIFTSATGTELNYETAVDLLDDEIERINTSLSEIGSEIRAIEGGYFVSFTDGFETLCCKDGNIYKSMVYAQTEGAVPYGPEDIEILLTSSAYRPNNNSCKVIADYTWYFAAIIDSSYLQRFYIGQSLILDIDNAMVKELPVIVISIVEDEENGKTMLLFSCEYLNSDMTGLRIEQGEISFRDYKGIRVPRSAIRVINGEIGVYVRYDNRVTFKKIDYIYETSDYVLAIPSEVTGELKLYDEIILEGKDLYDGKPLG